ncbi:hypothetical protein AVEN_176465-1 [Araneus ventricosus]|uniref:Uncharacterized protein n=1 Tax=Araneus ventricosus TaxID=182803 RepID=A0A4Y2JK94_ARAVE|nr:hypothetical protein AVEN_176465-1 [Araneus ventricosus]
MTCNIAKKSYECCRASCANRVDSLFVNVSALFLPLPLLQVARTTTATARAPRLLPPLCATLNSRATSTTLTITCATRKAPKPSPRTRARRGRRTSR